jgi:hypothetical protein
MDELDTPSWTAELQSYLYLRNRYWQWSILGGPAIISVYGVTNIAFPGEMSLITLNSLYLLTTAAIFVWMAGVAVMGYLISRFLCPRCGGRVAMAWWGFWPGRRCKHCGLDVGQSAKSAVNKFEKISGYEV